jgi:hypothetical protein
MPLLSAGQKHPQNVIPTKGGIPQKANESC